jgi:hypothetical protein
MCHGTCYAAAIDLQGRVAARIVGELPEASILEAIVRTLVAENA